MWEGSIGGICKNGFWVQGSRFKGYNRLIRKKIKYDAIPFFPTDNTQQTTYAAGAILEKPV
jgi:hypothetical protein